MKLFQTLATALLSPFASRMARQVLVTTVLSLIAALGWYKVYQNEIDETVEASADYVMQNLATPALEKGLKPFAEYMGNHVIGIGTGLFLAGITYTFKKVRRRKAVVVKTESAQDKGYKLMAAEGMQKRLSEIKAELATIDIPQLEKGEGVCLAYKLRKETEAEEARKAADAATLKLHEKRAKKAELQNERDEIFAALKELGKPVTEAV